MQFTDIDGLRSLTGLSDRRSIDRFLASLGLQLQRIGKRHVVFTDELEKALRLKYANRNPTPLVKYKPKTKVEKEFISDLQNKLSEL